MSYEEGWAAINLEMPKRVPRTEYSAHRHWDLIKAVTGREVSQASSEKDQRTAGKEFCKAWDYDYFWNILINGSELGDMRTKMGHVEYAAEGSDYNNDISCPFKTPEDVLTLTRWKCMGKRIAMSLSDGLRQTTGKPVSSHPMPSM